MYAHVHKGYWDEIQTKIIRETNEHPIWEKTEILNLSKPLKSWTLSDYSSQEHMPANLVEAIVLAPFAGIGKKYTYMRRGKDISKHPSNKFAIGSNHPTLQFRLQDAIDTSVKLHFASFRILMTQNNGILLKA